MTNRVFVNRVFVTGTDTNIGKTLVSAWLAQHWRAHYWKPVQAGTDGGTDPHTVRQLAPAATIIPPRWTLKTPASPHLAARLDDVQIRLEDFNLPAIDGPLVVEGAGGLLVPLNERDLMIDLMARLGLPVLLVARSGLGTINHTLLSLEALKSRRIATLGVVLSGPPDDENRQAIEQHGGTKVLAELPWLPEISADIIAALKGPEF